jgi:hypothetical protein
MAEFTLLKLQLDDASFGANTPLGSDDEPATEEGSTSVLPFFVGLLFLVGVAVAAKKLLGSSDTVDEVLEPQDA